MQFLTDAAPPLMTKRAAAKISAPIPQIANTLDARDPGDETQRNFRYQHGYGVILLLGAANRLHPYVALWCEHHDDFLCERADGLFDAYQIKTRRSENGPWTTSDEQLRKSIKRFIALLKRFPNELGDLFFVSNAECSDTAERNSIGRSPRQLRRKLLECDTVADLPEPFSGTVGDLASYCDCTTVDVFDCLRKVAYVKGPGRDSFDAEIAHDHVPTLPQWQGLSRAELNSVRDSLVFLIYKASSLQVDSPERHVCPIDVTDRRNPKLLAKRLEVSVAIRNIDIGPAFRFLPTKSHLSLDGSVDKASKLVRKLTAGGLGTYTEILERRAYAAERHLIEAAIQDPENAAATLTQIENVVYGACQEAHAEESLADAPFGQRMFVNVNGRLDRLATEPSSLIQNQPYELLSGVAMLLTGECKVWWSPRFDLEGAK